MSFKLSASVISQEIAARQLYGSYSEEAMVVGCRQRHRRGVCAVLLLSTQVPRRFIRLRPCCTPDVQATFLAREAAPTAPPRKA